MLWEQSPTLAMPAELDTAIRTAHRRTNLNMYRSRLNFDNEFIYTAFSWLWLPIITDNTVRDTHASFRFTTQALTRGDATQATDEAYRVYTNISNTDGYSLTIFNSVNNSQAAIMLTERFLQEERLQQLNVRPVITLNVNHSIKMFTDNTGRYFVISNQYTHELMFKLSAVMLNAYTPFDEEYRSALAQAYLSGTADNVINAIGNRYADIARLRQETRLVQAIENLTLNLDEGELQSIESNIRDKEEAIRQGYVQIDQMYARLRELQAQYVLKLTEDTSAAEEQLKTFLMSSRDHFRYIEYNARRKQLNFVYETALIYFDQNAYDIYAHSTRPNMVTNAAPAIKSLLDDIFVTRMIKMHFVSGVQLNMETGDIRYLDPYSIPDTVVDGLPNPHHRHFNCFGDNVSQLRRAVRNKDYVSAILQAESAIAGINIADATVFRRFIENDLTYSTAIPCLEVAATGERITIEEYIRRYNDAPNQTN